MNIAHESRATLSCSFNNFLLLLWELELCRAQMYDLFGRIFAGHKDSWLQLAEAKRDHAQWVMVMSLYLNKGMISTENTEKPLPEINSSIHCIEELMRRAAKGELNLREALCSAMAMEALSIDSMLLMYFRFNSPLVKKAGRDLHLAVRRYRNTIMDFMNRIAAEQHLAA